MWYNHIIMTSEEYMNLALNLARRGQGYVEPNPMVGAVIVNHGTILGQGWHKKYGGPHAEIEAFSNARELNHDVRGAEMYVSLEPCCHFGKTPPCAQAIIKAGIKKVYIALRDPNPKVDGGGVKALQAAGIEVESGVCESAARNLNAPFIKFITRRRPWVIAKWAMTLDGRIAAQDGSSRWISNAAAREITHKIRSRSDAVIVGAGTFLADNPSLNARLPEGQIPPRLARRIVFDLRGAMPPECNLLKNVEKIPAPNQDNNYRTWIISSPEKESGIQSDSLDVIHFDGRSVAERFINLLDYSGGQGATNVLVEGGGNLLGALFDAQLIDEIHAFIAPQLCGGVAARSPLAGKGVESMLEARRIINPEIELLGDNIYVHGALCNNASER